MLDLRLIREDPDAVRAALARRGGSFPIDEVIEVDARRRAVQARLDEMRAERKKGDKLIAKMQGSEKRELLERLKRLSAANAAGEREQANDAHKLNRSLLAI